MGKRVEDGGGTQVTLPCGFDANLAHYDRLTREEYLEETPHLKHAALRRLLRETARAVLDHAKRRAAQPHVLDLGAGEGSVTLMFLEEGAVVTAVDISPQRLAQLRERCSRFADRLRTVEGDALDAMNRLDGRFDVIVACSFLHHVPDYLSVVEKAKACLRPGGIFLVFQETPRYDTMRRLDYYFMKLAYYAWRAGKGRWGEWFRRFIAHRRGLLLEEDNVDYHLVRNGVDQFAICRTLEASGFRCQVSYYFSTMSRLWQWVGTSLGVRNTFRLIAVAPEGCERSWAVRS